jgi:arylsulfatase A-like enzyme
MNWKFSPSIIPALLALSLLTACKGENEDAVKPNFIIIQLDDLGYSDLGIHGNRIVETPEIDAFADQSVQFTNFYVNPVCAPTRASLLTGRHFLKTGVSHVHGGKDHLNLNENTLADIFKEAGYSTGMWGKWHSGTADGYLPWQRGFDEAYMAELYKHENNRGLFNGELVETQKWADDVICDYALDFIKRNEGKPWLAYMSFLTCHSPLHAPEELINIYENKGLSRNLSTLYAMIHHVDQSLGAFFDELEETGANENTLIMFMSDNGPAIENDKLTDEDREIRYVNDLKGHKGNIWENGIKSPLFIYWKAKYENMKIDALCDITDIVPTMMEIAELDPRDQMPELDGKSFAGLLEKGKDERDKISFNYANPGWPPTDKPWTPEGVMDEYRPLSSEMINELKIEDQIISVRKGKYKLLQNAADYPDTPEPKDNYVLINIASDPREEINLVNEEQTLYIELKAHLKAWFNEIKKSPHSFAMPVFNVHKSRPATLFAKAPQEISSDLKNTFNYLADWKQESVAWYTVDCSEETERKIKLEFMDVPPDNTQFKISAGKDELIMEPGEIESNDYLRLPEGVSLLRVECIKTDSPGFSLKNIVLLPVSSIN